MVIANGRSRQAARKVKELELLLAGTHDLNIRLTQYRRHASQLVRENVQLLIVAGGDGTLNECVDGLLRWKDEFPETVLPAIALLPTGSGNDFARNFGWKNDTKELIDRINRFALKKSDVGKITSIDEVRYFINVAGAGFDACVVKQVEHCPAWLGANLKYGWSILSTFFTYSKSTVAFRSREFSASGKMFMLVVANGKYFGSGICVAPDARPDDGLFDVTAIGNVNLFQYLKYFQKLRRGEKIIHREVQYRKTSRIEISGGAEVEMDGEMGLRLPITIEVVPCAVRFLE